MTIKGTPLIFSINFLGNRFEFNLAGIIAITLIYSNITYFKFVIKQTLKNKKKL